jgi:dihydrodipicolinate synthase/N-acetylneuraminate lyase
MNAVPQSAQQLMQAVVELGDLEMARRIYYLQILPLVDVMSRNHNPTGTIKAGVCARGVDVGAPRRPGSAVGPVDRRYIERLMAEIARAEERVAAELTAHDL